MVDYLRSLHDKGFIQYLIFSADNIGIQEALKIMFNAAPGEIIAYSQDDVLFYPGWLQAHLEILETFPMMAGPDIETDERIDSLGYARLSPSEQELAERFAYGLFMLRPSPLNTISLLGE